MRTVTKNARRLMRGLGASILLLAGGGAWAQSTVSLTAGPTTTTLPDGQVVPMWGYTCGAAATGATGTCAAANPKAGTGWSPVVITVPYTGATTSLTVSLTNNLSFTTTQGATTGATVTVPTSLIIVGQLGGGLGSGGTTAASPTHSVQSVTWPVANTGASNTPVAQANRVQSFGTEVAAGATTTLTWSNLRPGTYLIESGTHPSIQAAMGLYGVLVVTTPAGSAPAYTYNACVTGSSAPCDSYDANLPVILSEIDPVQNATVAAAVTTTGFSETAPWSGQPNQCGNPTSANYLTCYPPVVNYSPRYYLINGVSFDRTNLAGATASVLAPAAGATTVTPVTGNVMLNFVNAGSRMHVPQVVGLPFTLVAEDGNPLPGLQRVQNEVFLSAGKSYDVLVKPAQTAATGGVYTAATYPLFDRQLSLSTNNQRDGGMTAYIAVAGGAAGGVGTTASGTTLGTVTAKTYYCTVGNTLNVADPSQGVIGGVSGANGAALSGTPAVPAGATLAFNPNGTFSYTPPATGTCAGTFAYTVNAGTATYTATIAECDAASHAATGCALGGAPVLANDTYTAANASFLQINSPGLLLNDKDPTGLALKVDTATVTTPAGLATLKVNPDGSFEAVASTPCTAVLGCTYSFTYNVKNLQGTPAATAATVSVTFPAGSGLKLTLVDDKHPTDATRNITDYRWVIEEDNTFWTDPKCQIATAKTAARPTDSYGRACPPMPVESIGYNFHTANMKVVATGCVGTVSCEAGQTIQGTPTVCDIGNGICRTDGSATQRVQLTPDQVYLDPNKHYFISVMPGDAINPTINASLVGPQPTATGTRQFNPAVDCPNASDYTAGTGKCGHNMGGRQIPPQFDNNHNSVKPAVTIALAETPLPTAQIAVLVYEDDYPLNGENDAGGGVDILAPNEAGLGSFQIELLDQGGQFGDNNGQPTYDMFNMPLSNSLAGTLDPNTNQNACPITSNPDGIVGMIVTCPTYEADGVTKSPLAGQALIKNLYPGLYEVAAAPAADRIARGEEWLQTNTLDGGKPHEAFIRPGEPSFFQEFGPGGFHVQMGFANPKIINDRRTNSAGTGLCDAAPLGGGLTCNSSISGQVHGDHMARTPDERTYDTGSYDAFAFSHCYVSIGIPDQQDFAFAKCDAKGNFTLTGLPDGVYKMAVFDQWNDIMLDGLIAAVTVSGNTVVQPTVIQWRTNLYTRTYLDLNGNGIPDRVKDASGNLVDTEPGLGLLAMDVRYRDGSVGFKTSTDMNGYASNNEIFPFMNWLVVQPDTTRFKMTGIHVIYDAGGPDDCSDAANAAATAGGYTAKCSNSGSHLAGTLEQNSLPAALRIPGAVYCTDADCAQASESIQTGTYYQGATGSSGIVPSGSTYLSSGRIDPPYMTTEGYQGLLGQHSFIDFGMKPFKAATPATSTTPALPAENGGITGMVAYSSTRPFDDPTLLVQNPWEPLVPNVQVNLYQESTNADGFTTLTLVDSTQTSSWDKWAQGFRTDGTGTGNLLAPVNSTVNSVTTSGYIPNLNCPGQDPTSPFFQTLQGSKMWLDTVDPTTGQKKTIAYNSQFKCYDGWAMMNQIQPAPFDGKYTFPSVADRDPVTGRPSGTGSLNGVATPVKGTNCTICIANPDDGNPMLPPGKYVVEVVVPSGWELVKEEDKNILVGDVYIAPVTQQFAGVGNVFILPDQATVNGYYNSTNAQNPTTTLGVLNLPRSDFNVNTDQVWPCVGAVRQVPDYLSLFPGVKQVAPFAGAYRPLCDRKEVVLSDQMTAGAKFFIYTKNHVAGHFTGMMTNDMASEFDPFSPQFGEKFGAANLPVNMRDFMGTEMSRVYGDQWGVYNGMYFSTWEVNPPNPTGYAPQMSIACMNDPGPILDTNPYLPGGTTPNPTYGQMITDPAYNPAYSNFCYEQMFMPGMTNYMDTPVTPVMAFADHYNLPDAEFPNATPMVQRADYLTNGVTASGATNAGGNGPWTSVANLGATLTIQAVGDKVVQNPQYTGPSGTVAPYNTKSVIRHYGFGTQCTALSATCPAVSSVTIGGVPASIATWSDTTLTVSLPSTAITGGTSTTPHLPLCTVQQQGQSATYCGELVITAGNGKQSVTGITVTVGGKTPTLVTTSGPVTTTFGEFFPNPLQAAIDAATPGDLLILDAGTYHENAILWKPLRLQGVGAPAVTINADAHPAGKMDPWRRRVDCLFGLTLAGWINPNNTAFDPTNTYSCPASMYFRADRLPFEGFVGWDASSNGNLAQVLQEPSLMGAYEGAGLTVVGRGVYQPNATDLWGQGGGAGTYINGSVYLTAANATTYCPTATTSLPSTEAGAGDYGTGNFYCNPSGLDGVTVTNSSQGGGGIFLHGWNSNFQIANDRIVANAGTLSGGINIGNGESPPVALIDGVNCGNGVAAPAPLCPPLSSPFANVNGNATNQAIPAQLQPNVHVHHNQIIANASIGDALFSGSPAGAGGITISAGSDGYEIDHNWVAANLTSSDGGGIAHMGVSFGGRIHNNVVLFNEANNPTLSVDGGGIIVMGAQEDRTLITTGQECGGTQDLDCPPGIGDGTGPGLVIDSNLLLGNSAAYGSGGGLRLRQVNGTEVSYFPGTPASWYGVTVSNNIIANNVAGWDGAGVSLQDAFEVNVINNTIVANDTTASAGVLFKQLGAIDQASPPPGCVPTPDPSQPQAPGCLNPNAPHIPQPAGLVTMQNTPNMMASMQGYISNETGALVFTGRITCPSGYGYGTVTNGKEGNLVNGRCLLVSLPKLTNDLFWQNRAFHVEMLNSAGQPVASNPTPSGTGLQSQQNIIALLPTFTQTATGQCVDPTGLKNTDGSALQLYWDVGVRMDTLPNANGHALVFNPQTVAAGYNLEGYLTATVTGGAVTAITIVDAGGAYTSAPTVSFVGGGGTGAAATVTVDTNTASATYGNILSVKITAGGTGYTVAPTIVLAGGGITPNSNDNGAIGLSASNSIFSDSLNVKNLVGGTSNLAPNAGAGGAGLLVAQYCNGARVPPEQCSSAQGANNQGMCLGYFTPAGISENVGVPQVFKFLNISATATVDEGNNWINMTYGPLTLTRPAATAPSATPSTPQEQIVTVAAVGATAGAYSLPGTSAAIEQGTNVGAPSTDFYGQTRALTAAHPADIGAVAYTGAIAAPVLTGGPLTFGSTTAPVVVTQTSASQNLTLTNTGTATFSAIAITVAGPFTQTATTCGAALAPAAACTISIAFVPTAAGTATGSVTVTGNAVVVGSPATLTGYGAAAVYKFTIAPAAAAFGSVAIGSTGTIAFTTTNTGNVPLAGGTNTWQPTGVSGPFAAVGSGLANACTATLAVGASCSFNMTFKPTVTGAATATLGVNYTGAPTVNVVATGTGVYALTVTGGPLAFGNVNAGTVAAARNLTVTAGAGLTAAQPITLGAFPAGFSRSTTAAGTCAATLAAGTSCTIGVVFSPTLVQAYTGTLAISSGTNTVSGSPVTFTGTGTSDATLYNGATGTTVPSGAFGNVRVGASGSLTYHLTAGTTALAGIATNVTGTGFARPAGTAGGTCGTTLAAAGTCTIIVTYTPTTLAAGTGSLAVTSTTSPVTNAPVALTGTGVASFTLAAVGGNLTIQQNQGVTRNAAITVTNINGFTGTVGLAVTSGLPAGATFAFTGTPATNLTVFVPATVATGTYPLTITGTSGTGATATTPATTTLTLVVTAQATFTITPAATTLAVSRGANLLKPATDMLSIAKTNGFASAITFTAAVTACPSAPGATTVTTCPTPAGAQAGSLVLGFTPTGPLAASATTPVTDTLTIKPFNGVIVTGAYTVTVTGTVAATGTSNAFTVTKNITVNVGL